MKTSLESENNFQNIRTPPPKVFIIFLLQMEVVIYALYFTIQRTKKCYRIGTSSLCLFILYYTLSLSSVGSICNGTARFNRDAKAENLGKISFFISNFYTLR
jgi:hypothetical protein